MKTENRPVILMAYGGPASLDEIELFLSSVFGKKPSPEIVEITRKRYAAIGGKTPLIEDVFNFSKRLEDVLNKNLHNVRVFPAFRFSKPSVEDAVYEALNQGSSTICGIPFTSFHSVWSYEGYRNAFKQALLKSNKSLDIRFVEPYYKHPLFINHWKKIISKIEFDSEHDFLVFSAHSLPLTDASATGIYPSQVKYLSSVLAEALKTSNWTIGYLSAGKRGGEWLKPSLSEVIEKVKKEGFKRVAIVPVGFLSESVETLYDLDIEAKTFAQKNSLNFLRTKTPLNEKGFEKVMSGILEDYLT